MHFRPPPLTAAWRAVLPALLFLPMVLAPPLNHDVAAVLAFTRRWLAGERLYVDLIDVNPPLIFLLNVAPAMLAEFVPQRLALVFCVLALGGVCGWLSARARDRATEGMTERAFLDALPVLLVLGAGYDFGQREHLMVIAALPYVCTAAGRATGRRVPGAVAIAVLAALGFALKPFFLVVPAMVEVSVLLARRPSGLRALLGDATPWLLGLVWLVYLAVIALGFPDFHRVVLPMIWEAYVDLGSLTWAEGLAVPFMATSLALLLPGLVLAWVGAGQGALPRLLGCAGVGAVMAALAQHKGWSYHILPTELFALALVGLVAARWRDRADPARDPGRAAMGLVGLAVVFLVANGDAPWMQLAHPGGEAERLSALLRGQIPNGRVLALSAEIHPVFPATNDAGVRTTQRAMSTWPLQGAYATCPVDGSRFRAPAAMGPAEAFFFRTLAEDFSSSPPDAVLLDTDPGLPACNGQKFDFVAYFSRHPAFAATWARYRRVGAEGMFQLYRRGPAPP